MQSFSLSLKLKVLAQNITRIREIKNISQKEIAEHLGITPGTVSRWERKRFNNIKYTSMVKIIDYLEDKGVNFSDFDTPQK